jgi:hypothetical protein
MGLHPGQHVPQEQQVVAAAEGMEVQAPLGNDDRLGHRLREVSHPVQAARLGGEDLLPFLLVVERARGSVRVGATGTAVPVEDVAPDVIDIRAARPRFGHRGRGHVQGPQELEMLAGY